MSTHVIAQYGRVRIVRGVWDSIVQIQNATGEEWLDYGSMSFETFDQFRLDHSDELNRSIQECWEVWIDTPVCECSTVAADAMAARDDVLPS
jgi:hypothetical protein